MLFFSKSSTFREAGRFEMWDNGYGNQTNADFNIIFNTTTIPNNVNIGNTFAFTNATTNTVNIGGAATTVNINGADINIARSRITNNSPYYISHTASDYYQKIMGGGSFTIAMGAYYKVVHCSPTANMTVTLPYALNCYGAVIVIANNGGTNFAAGSSTITINVAGGNIFVPGDTTWNATYTLTSTHAVTLLASNFTNIGDGWMVIAYI
jgi:hypothetical protein